MGAGLVVVVRILGNIRESSAVEAWAQNQVRSHESAIQSFESRFELNGLTSHTSPNLTR